MVRLFFLVFSHIWQEHIAKIPKLPGAPGNVNPAREQPFITPFFNNNSPPPRQFLLTKYFFKNYLGKMNKLLSLN